MALIPAPSDPREAAQWRRDVARFEARQQREDAQRAAAAQDTVLTSWASMSPAAAAPAPIVLNDSDADCPLANFRL